VLLVLQTAVFIFPATAVNHMLKSHMTPCIVILLCLGAATSTSWSAQPQTQPVATTIKFDKGAWDNSKWTAVRMANQPEAKKFLQLDGAIGTTMATFNRADYAAETDNAILLYDLGSPEAEFSITFTLGKGFGGYSCPGLCISPKVKDGMVESCVSVFVADYTMAIWRHTTESDGKTVRYKHMVQLGRWTDPAKPHTLRCRISRKNGSVALKLDDADPLVLCFIGNKQYGLVDHEVNSLVGLWGCHGECAFREMTIYAEPTLQFAAKAPEKSAAEEREQIERDAKALGAKLASVAANIRKSGDAAKLDQLADAEQFHKGIEWALRYDLALSAGDIALLKKSVLRGQERADALAAGKAPWTTKKGKVLRGYVSAIDGSTQPYGVVIPSGYDGSKPKRLDVVLHGSSKPVGMSETRFGSRFDDGDEAGKAPPDVDFIELDPLGRVENCYRWAGETDVFEAIEAVCRNYRIDRDRIVLRGMSMGASGTWHLGLKHPSYFVAIGPYCGYVDTHRFSQTPHFIRVDALPWYQERGLHMLDSIDYAANAGVVPEIAAIGDKDPFFNYSHVIMEEAMAKEGLKMVNLISPGTAHMIDPVTHKEQMRRIGEYAAKGLDHGMRKIRFVTWTLKYNVCHWIELLALKQHYERSEIQAVVADDGSIDIPEAVNISSFAIHPPMLQAAGSRLRIGGIDVPLPQLIPGNTSRTLAFAQEGGKWKCVGPRAAVSLTGKRPGVQGPIDDAFTAPFLCVRGTGQPWNPAVGSWADANLRRFIYEYARYMRGDVPVKDDTQVTPDDIRSKNLILFGDPGSNSWIAKALPNLPVVWTREDLALGGEHYSAKDHGPVLITSNPLPGAGDHYLVLNSGHTFHEKEFAAYNYLLFPRLGDWAVMKTGEGAATWGPSIKEFPEETIAAGFFDEQWKQAVTAPK